MAFGARTSFLPNTDMLTNVGGAGDQLAALGEPGFGFENMYEWIGRLRADKERERRAAALWDQQQDEKLAFRDRLRQHAADPSTMRSTSMPGGGGIGSTPMGRLAQNMDTLQGMRQDFYGQRIGSNPRFADMLPAAGISGVDVMQGRGTGWDQYAALAGAGAGQSAQAEQAAGRMRELRAMGRSRPTSRG